MNSPKISAIITTYNCEKYLEEAIKSVLNQTFKEYELLVIDDGSTDNTKKIVMKYRDKLDYFYKKNGGHADARNYGIKKARAEYVAFLDSDDLWYPKKLEICYTELIKKPEAGLVYSNLTIIDKKGRVVLKKLKRPHFKKNYPCILLGNYVSCQGSLIKKSCLKEIGLFNYDLDMYEDWDLFIRLARKYRFVFIDQPLFFYRTNKDSKFTKHQLTLRLKRQLKVLENAFQVDNRLKPFFKRKCISNVYFDLFKSCLSRKQFIRAFEFALIGSVKYFF